MYSYMYRVYAPIDRPFTSVVYHAGRNVMDGKFSGFEYLVLAAIQVSHLYQGRRTILLIEIKCCYPGELVIGWQIGFLKPIHTS